jgi:ABC-type oligopeptide transport system substrate-binding subunit
VYGIKRVCDPRLDGYVGYMPASIIAGCDTVYDTSPDTATDSLVYGDTTQVSAPDDYTLTITTQQPAGYFPAMLATHAFYAVPREAVEGSLGEGEVTGAGAQCTITTDRNVNMRSGPGTGYDVAGTLNAGGSADVDGQATGTDDYIWWHLLDDAWVREDVVNWPEACSNVPFLDTTTSAGTYVDIDWTQPGDIVTNGPYFIEENVRGVRRVFVRNHDLPVDLSGEGNIERVVQTYVEDSGTAFALYQDDQLDTSGIPEGELQGILDDPDYSDELTQIFDLSVFYFGFAQDKEPFDNTHARRAFSAIIDRQAFVEQVRQGQGVPMIHFTPPGAANAPPINEVGVGFDPEFANSQLELAGYPNCEGFPDITVVVSSGDRSWAEFWAASAETYLGCDPAHINIEEMDFATLWQATSPDNPTEDRPNAWTLHWGAHYGDANAWVNEVLHCKTSRNPFKRDCTYTDDMITQAATSTDQDERAELYAEIEDEFFGPVVGEFPVVPLYMRSGYTLYKPWYTGPFETDGLYSGAHWGAYTIDMEAKLAARAGNK